jgi:hypothetical protein
MILNLTDREQRLIEYLRKNGIPFGEMLVRFFYQDSVIVRMVIEDKKESVKL